MCDTVRKDDTIVLGLQGFCWESQTTPTAHGTLSDLLSSWMGILSIFGYQVLCDLAVFKA